MASDALNLTVELTPDNRTARAFVPGHITGLFRIYDEHRDPLYRGSMGAGFSVSAGTLTTITVIETDEPMITTKYNERKIQALVTETVVEKLSEDFNVTLSVEITHESDLPIGVGFGASGAGALGTALALSSIVAPELDFISASQYAHYAEVVNHAGLGDVIAQTVGGIEVRTAPGAPGIGETSNIAIPEGRVVVLAGSTGLETKDVLTDPKSRERINNEGEKRIKSILANLSLERIVNHSKDFSKAIGLETPRIQSALTDLHASGFEMSSMVMLGDSVFSLCQESEVTVVESILRNYWDSNEIIDTTFSHKGGELRA
ncbi:MAG: pantoate kinase [Candidatus Thorarchaeota archaeon]|jgi:pantoate kinase